MLTKTRLVIVAVIAVLAATVPLPAQERRPAPNNGVELRGRHPDLYQSQVFSRWREGKTVGPWHESAAGAGRLVVIQDGPGNSVFAALVERNGDITSTHVFDLVTERKTRALVNEAIRARLPASTIHAIRPNVSYSNNTWTLEWEVEVQNGNRIERYLFEPGGTLTPARSPGAAPLVM